MRHQVIDRRAFLGAFTVLAAPRVARAQKIPAVGYLALGTASAGAPLLEAFRAGLRDTGHVEGQTVRLEVRWGEGDRARLARLAGELIAAEKVDVILLGACGRPNIEAVRHVNRTIPLVVAICGDIPGYAGEVASLSRPGGHTTGLTLFAPS